MNIPLDSSEEELVTALRRENCCLMTDEDGVELYDGQGNLLICKAASGECMAVPNIEALRKLYDLPVDGGKASDSLNNSKIIKNSKKIDALNLRVDSLNDQTETFILHEEEQSPVVWMGQRTTKCQEAAKSLIRLFDTPKYRRLMNDKTTIKLKVWEKLACELQGQHGGFKIADTPRDAGLRTFQKWRNMERTYWKYLRNPDECGEDKRRKKPWFFDEMHAVMSKRRKFARFCLGQEAELEENFSDEEEMMDDDFLPDKIPAELRLKQGMNAALSPGAVENLLKLIDKYRYLFRTSGKKKMKVWEKIYEDLVEMGYEIPGESKRIQIERLFQKWRNLKKGFIRYHIDQDRLYGKSRKTPRLLHYDLLFKMCSRDIIEEEMSRNRTSGDSTDPLNSLQIYPLDFQEMLHPNPLYLDHDYEATEHRDLLGRTKSPVTSCMDMETSPTAPAVKVANSSDLPVNPPIMSTKVNDDRVTVPSLPTKQPRTLSKSATSVKSSEILLQIKCSVETALAAQQQHLSKITTLLEEQVKEQKTLNLLFTQYVTNVSKKHKSSKNSQRNEINNGNIDLQRSATDESNQKPNGFDYSKNVGNDYSRNVGNDYSRNVGIDYSNLI